MHSLCIGNKVKEWYEKGYYGYKGRAWGDNQAPFIAGEAAFWFGSAASFGGMKGVVPNFYSKSYSLLGLSY